MGNVIGFIIGLTAGATFGALLMALMVAAGDYDRMEDDRYLEGWESGVRYGKRFHEEITKGEQDGNI